MSGSRPTHLLLDLDGTVLNTIPGIVQSVRYACETHLNHTFSDDVLIAGIGTPLLEQMQSHWVRLHKKPIDHDIVTALCDTYIEHNRAHHDDTVCPYPGVIESLERLYDAGIPMGIVTSKPHSTARRGLRVCGLEALFRFVIGFDEVTNPKPHPEPILMALTRMECAAHNAIYIGDSPHDMLAGRRAGVRTGAALWGPFKREQLIESEPTYWLKDGTDIEQLYINVNSP